jgi:hypothetical protein
MFVSHESHILSEFSFYCVKTLRLLYKLTLKIAACHISYFMLEKAESLMLSCCDCDECWEETAIAAFSSSLMPQRYTRNLAR